MKATTQEEELYVLNEGQEFVHEGQFTNALNYRTPTGTAIVSDLYCVDITGDIVKVYAESGNIDEGADEIKSHLWREITDLDGEVVFVDTDRKHWVWSTEQRSWVRPKGTWHDSGYHGEGRKHADGFRKAKALRDYAIGLISRVHGIKESEIAYPILQALDHELITAYEDAEVQHYGAEPTENETYREVVVALAAKLFVEGEKPPKKDPE